MLRFFRNAIMFLAMAVLVFAITWFFDMDALSAQFPAKWESRVRDAFAVNAALSVGVLVGSFALAFLVQARRPVWWVLVFGALWALVALFPNLGWVSRSHGPSGFRLGSVFLWGPLLVVFAMLLGLRLAATVQRLVRPRSGQPPGQA